MHHHIKKSNTMVIHLYRHMLLYIIKMSEIILFFVTQTCMSGVCNNKYTIVITFSLHIIALNFPDEFVHVLTRRHLFAHTL